MVDLTKLEEFGKLDVECDSFISYLSFNSSRICYNQARLLLYHHLPLICQPTIYGI